MKNETKFYNTKYECRYYKEDVILPDDNVTNDEIEYIRNILYQEDFLSIFFIDNEENDINVLSNVVYELYEKIKDNDILKMFMDKAASKIMTEELQLGLCLLYSYDYMYLTHKCVSEYLNTGFISLDSIDNLNKNLQ
jgi:hypothetical protein